ncbi:TetR family transcriptional regulator [Fluviicoccus keumensis]|uniref:TetR family transcriptional regulator n=1 Tax=Fluviicoccus keumensis TaxID=1435465 RepID=A0A4Q7YMH6_9GAMM|nr:TetR/AcrR family transcriptional regulator [Fluviicoccus keumensis]RZU38570.1 TetR family transcriptional regulator [Fluviicoccus keumensis]
MPRKPRQARSLATVNAIVDAGFLCLARYGLVGTTTNHIAEVAGISTGSLYEYFANKEAVYAAMSERFLADIGEMVRAYTPQVSRMEIGEAIRTLAQGFAELLSRNDGRYLHLVRYILLADSRDFSEQVSKLLMDFVVQYLLNHPQYMRLKDLQTMVYIVINAGIFNIMRFLSSDSPPMSFEALIDGFARLVNHHVVMDLAE